MPIFGANLLLRDFRCLYAAKMGGESDIERPGEREGETPTVSRKKKMKSAPVNMNVN